MEGSSGGPSGGFTRAVVEAADFDASQYGFFGEMQLPNEDLGGALEDGLEAPPEEQHMGGFDEEDLPLEQLLSDEDDDDEDLSLAAMFAKRAAIAAGTDVAVTPPSKRQQPRAASPGPAPPPVPSLLASMRGASGAGAGPPVTPPPAASQPFSIGLDLLGALPGSTAKQQEQQQQSTPLLDGRGALGGTPLGQPLWQQSTPLSAATPGMQGLSTTLGSVAMGGTPLGPSSVAGGTPLGAPLPTPPSQPRPSAGGVVHGAMTAEELEAQMIASARKQAAPAGGDKGLLALLKSGGQQPAQQQPPQQQQPPPPQQQQPGMQPPYPMHPGMPPPGQPFPQGPPPPWAQGMMPSPGPGGFPPYGMPPGGPMPPPHGPPFPHPPHFPGGPFPPMMGPLPPGARPPMMGPGGPMGPAPGQLPPGFQPPPGYGPPQQLQAMTPPGKAPGPPGQQQADGQPAPRAPLHHQPPPGQQQQQGGPQQRGSGTFGAGFAPDAPQQGGGGGGGGGHAYGGFGAYGSVRRPLYRARLMDTDEIEHVLRIQYSATHTGDPYVEDYYAQAYRHKYLGGRNAATFAPDALRRGGGSGYALREARHASIEGLGRFVLSNIRTPKRLMDVGGGGSKGAGDQGKGADAAAAGKAAARLEDEPMLAARILIEDCFANLLRVEDLDRAAAADEAAGVRLDPGSEAGAALRRERGALLRGIVASLQLADAPAGGGADGLGDWVFMRVLQLPKGRLMLAKALRFMCHPATGTARPSAGPAGFNQRRGGDGPRQRQQQRGQDGDGAAAAAPAASGAAQMGEGIEAPVVWAVLRNARELFGPAIADAASSRAEGEKRMTAATEALAAATAEALRHCVSASDVAAAAAALLAGLQSSAYPLLPLHPAGRAAPGSQPPWLGSVVSALLLRATELGLGSGASVPAASLRDGSGAGDEEEEDGAEATTTPADPAAAAAWAAAYAEIEAAIARHLEALHKAKLAGGDGDAAAAAAAAAGMPAAVLEQLRVHAAELACVPLVRALVSDHARGEARERLRTLLMEAAR